MLPSVKYKTIGERSPHERLGDELSRNLAARKKEANLQKELAKEEISKRKIAEEDKLVAQYFPNEK